MGALTILQNSRRLHTSRDMVNHRKDCSEEKSLPRMGDVEEVKRGLREALWVSGCWKGVCF